MTSDPAVLLTIDACVARLVLNRPATGNAMDPSLVAGLRERTREIEQRDDVRAVVVAATGKTFCVGGDLRYFETQGDDVQAAVHALASRSPRCHRVPRPPGGAGRRGGQRSGRGRRVGPRLRRRHRDRGSLGDLHLGVHGGRPLARRREHVVPPPSRRHQPCGGADAHQPSARCSECGGCRHRDPCRGRRGARVGGRARRFAARCGTNACARER